MSIDVVRGSSRKPVASVKLAELMRETDLSGQLFIGYPIIATPEGPYSIDALFVSAEKGIVVFDLIEGTDTGDYGLRQDDSANKLEARLRVHRELVHRRAHQRELRIPIHTLSFAPAVSHLEALEEYDYRLVNSSSLIMALQAFTWRDQQDEIYENTLSALESISTIRKGKVNRTVQQESSRGSKLQALENAIATLDNTQSKAVIETIEGVQRIRGLAGSGKTIVLALKAAYLHAQNPEWRIGVTFNTRSLKGQFQRLINTFTIAAGREPDWENLRILNAWGAPGGDDRDGMYYEFCRAHDIAYFDFMSARRQFGREREFASVCEHALGQVRESKQLYDAILIDEAQDFSPAFLRLCYALLADPKRLVYAYDELQNLTGESLPAPEDIFGNNADGVRFDVTHTDGPRPDIILERCYRNSRPVLVTAHALGFGVYRKPRQSGESGLVQMFDQSQLWGEIGYRAREGELREGAAVSLYRSEDTSPKFLENHSDISDLIQFLFFRNEEEQTEWLVKAIRTNLEIDELRHDDVVVINPDPLTTRKKVGPIRSRLLEVGVTSHLAGVDTKPDVFFRDSPEGSVTFTGIYRAKGNEAGMVYVINAQDCHAEAGNLASLRNRLFTALTRSKAWIRVLGVGGDMEELKQEYEKLKERNFELKFTYPTQDQREQLRIIHRDMTQAEWERLKSGQRGLDDLLGDIESGTRHLEDLDKDLIARLRKVLMETG